MRKNEQISCAVTVQLIRAFVFSLWIVPSLFFLNTKFLSIFYGCAARFVPGMVGNLKTGPGQKSEDRFSRNVANFTYIEKKTNVDQLCSYCTADLQLLFSYAKF